MSAREWYLLFAGSCLGFLIGMIFERSILLGVTRRIFRESLCETCKHNLNARRLQNL